MELINSKRRIIVEVRKDGTTEMLYFLMRHSEREGARRYRLLKGGRRRGEEGRI
jgi:hypothetical protein